MLEPALPHPRPRPGRWSLAAAAALAGVLTAACVSRSPVGTDHVGPELGVLEPCALYADEPNALSEWMLRLLDAEDEFERDPRAVLELMHRLCVQEPARPLAFVIADLAYLAGKRTGGRDLFLLSSVAALTYLVGDADVWGAPADPFDRRFRWSCDLYNRGLGRAFAGDEPGTFRLEPGPHAAAVGSVELALDLAPFPFEVDGIELLLADERRVRGLDFRVRDSGLGAPLIAVVRRALESTSEDGGGRDRTSVSATAFLRPDGDLRGLAGGLRATLELHSTSDAKRVEVAGTELPLEADQSVTVAYGTELAGYWRQDLRGLFAGRNARRENGLILPRPYQQGRIPVVLVHGTASSPTYWAELQNTLAADPVVRSRYQFWLFMYTTGNPIAYSAASLREELAQLVRVHDPEGEDPALRRMVLIGHSQGGLVVKMLGIELDADTVLREALGKGIDELELEPDQEALVHRLYDLEPLPWAERMVFVATPHRGSFLAASWFARLMAKMIAVPGELVSTTEGLLRGIPEERLPRGLQKRVGTSLDNMDPDSLFVRLLAEAPFDRDIHTHSIVAIGDATEPEGADDGVVAYESAHLDGAESECLVASGHSCQAHPRTLMEVRRILREHVGLTTLPLEERIRAATEVP